MIDDERGPTFERGTHRWVSFHDDNRTTWMFDLTFLTSNWTCIYGRGCKGTVDDPEVGAIQGCCSHGAYMIDDDDIDHVVKQAARLTSDQWQNQGVVAVGADLFDTDDDGDVRTRKVDGACIFLNGPDFGTSSGCALHYAAVANGEPSLKWKPAACWQLPFRLEETLDAANNSTFVIRPWYRGDWGEGGYDFPWWCTDDASPLVGESAVYKSLRDELIALIGPEPYNWLAAHIEGEAGTGAIPVETPRRRVSSERDPQRSSLRPQP